MLPTKRVCWGLNLGCVYVSLDDSGDYSGLVDAVLEDAVKGGPARIQRSPA